LLTAERKRGGKSDYGERGGAFTLRRAGKKKRRKGWRGQCGEGAYGGGEKEGGRSPVSKAEPAKFHEGSLGGEDWRIQKQREEEKREIKWLTTA